MECPNVVRNEQLKCSSFVLFINDASLCFEPYVILQHFMFVVFTTRVKIRYVNGLGYTLYSLQVLKGNFFFFLKQYLSVADQMNSYPGFLLKFNVALVDAFQAKFQFHCTFSLPQFLLCSKIRITCLSAEVKQNLPT